MLYWVKAESVCCSLTDCQAKSSVPGSYLTAVRSPSLQSLPEYTVNTVHSLSVFFLSVLKSYSPDHHNFRAGHKQLFLPVSIFLPYQICSLVNTLNLIDSHHMSVYVWLFPSVLVVYLYIKCDVSKAGSSACLLRELWKENLIIPKPPCLFSGSLIVLLPSGSVPFGLVCITSYQLWPKLFSFLTVSLFWVGLWG